MINRGNYHDRILFLKYCEDVRQNKPGTVRTREAQLRRVLEWADEVPLAKVETKRPTLPQYLHSLGLTYSSQKDTCKAARLFFDWAIRYRRGYNRLSKQWVESLRPIKAQSTGQTTRPAWTLEDVRNIVAYEPPTLTLMRDRAAVVMLFLSGMRVRAFVTMPILAVDLGNLSIRQLTGLGVRTKNDKSATTFLLPIPDLLQVVQEWHSLVSDQLSPTDAWYAPIDPNSLELVSGVPIHESRHTRLRKGIRKLCKLAGVPYKSPHALRRGFVLYAYGKAHSLADKKAVSQNVMHSDTGITDSVYAGLPEDDLGRRIARLTEEGSTLGGDATDDDRWALVLEELREIKTQLKRG